jgi:hypothetical protein
MSPYELFKFNQILIGKGYNGSVDDFKVSSYYPYFNMLIRHYNNTFDTDYKLKRFCSILFNIYGEQYNPFKLESEEYLLKYKEWESVHRDKFSYKKDIKNTCDFIFKFCVDKKIYDLTLYVSKWSISHIICGKINYNIAYLLGVQNQKISIPHSVLLNKKFLRNIPMIKKRLDREKEIMKYCVDEIEDIKE